MNLTVQEIDTMPAGKGLDALIALYVLNAQKIEPQQIETIKMTCVLVGRWNPGDNFADTLLVRKLPQRNPYTGCESEFIQPYAYSSRVDAAYAVVEEMKGLGLRLKLIDVGECHYAEFLDEYGRGENNAKGETPMLAICRAALKAKLAEMKSREERIKR